MSSVANNKVNLFTTCNVDYLIDDLHIHPLPIDFILIWVCRVDLLDIKIDHIWAYIRKSPGHTVIMPNDHSGHPGKRKTSDIVCTIRSFRCAMQANLVPNSGHLHTQVHIICQNGHP